MKTSELLIKAKALIDSPEKWTQNEYARNKTGKEVNTLSESAVCFCSMGALYKTVGRDISLPLNEALNAIDKVAGINGAVNFNDTHSHEEVMAVWDKAIAEAKRLEANDGKV